MERASHHDGRTEAGASLRMTSQGAALDAAYAELVIRWIGITSLEQDLRAGRIPTHNVPSSQAELSNRRRVYEARLAEARDCMGAPAAECLRRWVEQQPGRPALMPVPEMPLQSRRVTAGANSSRQPGAVQPTLFQLL